MKDLTKGKISKNLFIYSVPIILTYLLSRTHTTIDKVMIGQLVGENGLAAIGSTSSFITVISALFWSFGTGISLFVASNIKKASPKDLVRQIRSGSALVIGFSATLSFVAIILQSPIFSLLSVGQEIYDDARIYYWILLTGQALMAFNSYSKEIFYYLGKPSYAFKFSLIDCVGNVALNYLLLSVFDLGVFGVAIATVTVMLVSAIISAYFLRKEINKLYDQKTTIRVNKSELIYIIKLAIPCILQQGLLYLASAIVLPTINRFGTPYVAAYSVCTEIYNVCTVFFFGSSKAVSIYCTQSIGQKRSVLLKGFFVGIRQSVLLSATLIIPMMIFPLTTASLFLKDASVLTAQLVVRYINLCFPFIIFEILNNLFHNIFRGLLVPKLALITTAVYMLTHVSSVLLLAPIYEMDGVYIGNIAAWVAESIICVILFLIVLKKTFNQNMSKNTSM